MNWYFAMGILCVRGINKHLKPGAASFNECRRWAPIKGNERLLATIEVKVLLLGCGHTQYEDILSRYKVVPIITEILAKHFQCHSYVICTARFPLRPKEAVFIPEQRLQKKKKWGSIHEREYIDHDNGDTDFNPHYLLLREQKYQEVLRTNIVILVPKVRKFKEIIKLK